MRLIIQLFAAIIFCTSISAQTDNIRFSGKLDTKIKKSVIHLRNINGVNILISIDSQNNFSFVTDSLVKGFYEIDEIGTVYLCPGYQLTVQPGKEEEYVFNGRGALENNVFRTAKKQLTNFLPIAHIDGITGNLGQSAYYLEPPVFLQKLDSFQKQAVVLFNKSSDQFFRKYAALDVKYYGKHLLGLYSLYYGTDLGKWTEMNDTISKLVAQLPGSMHKIDSIEHSIHKKQMTQNDRVMLTKLIWSKMDRENDTLFRNSIYYQQNFPGYFALIKIDQYIANGNVNKLTDRNVQILKIARGSVKNPYLLAYFDYSLTGKILREAKDTSILNTYYNEYLTRASRQDYVVNIKNIYKNRMLYIYNAAAPEFSYKNIFGHPVSLKHQLGNFVYIDVWATFCEPCKIEIPYLKELEVAYQGKNIEFISISVDKQQDINLWEKFVKNNGLKGIQLISDNAFESTFMEKMNINSIPRFILIDPAGKLIAADALRPSNKELSTLLDKLL